LQSKTKYYYLLIFAMFLWGGGWSALKVLTSALPMDIIIFWRFFIMSLAFLPILYFFKKKIIFSKKSIKFILLSTILNILFMVFSYLGIKYSFAGSGSVIITTLSPIMTFLLAFVLFKKSITKRQIFGLFLGLVGGSIMLKLNSLDEFFHSSNIYFLLCAITWAGVTLLAQHSKEHINPLHYSFFIAIGATAISFLFSYSSDLTLVFNQDFNFWFSLIFLSVFGQAVATTIFFIASGEIGGQKTSSFMFLVPIFALFIAWIFLNEPIEMHIVTGGIVGMIALYFINKY